jgi:hypothetical protein
VDIVDLCSLEHLLIEIIEIQFATQVHSKVKEILIFLTNIIRLVFFVFFFYL